MRKRDYKISYPDRDCKLCKNYPCFTGFEKMYCQFAKAGCVDYVVDVNKLTNSNNDGNQK